MIRFTFYLGTDTNGRVIDAESVALRLAAEHFPMGHSIGEEIGRWMTEQGLVTEKSIVVTYLCEASKESETRASRFAGAYKEQAFQEAVLVTREEVDGFFV